MRLKFGKGLLDLYIHFHMKITTYDKKAKCVLFAENLECASLCYNIRENRMSTMKS